ncbi:MAG: ribonuclease HII [Deltaproteobacteria bacterium]
MPTDSPSKEKLPLALLRERLRRGERLAPGTLEALALDPRAGAQALVRRIESHRRRERAESSRLYRMLEFERAAREEGHALIAGVDEAGMAPLAGPVVAAAAILRDDCRPRGLDDSKKLDRETRERLEVEVKAGAVAWAVGLASIEEIDQLNIYHAGLLAMRRAVEALSARPDALLVDARRIPGVPQPQRPIIHGDALSLSIAAASVIAKTHRDALMAELDRAHPGYGFAQHKGYPTPEHLEILKARGACPIHRRSFAPVREALGEAPRQRSLF